MKHGFTLIEIAIVLVVIGLVVGGVVVGRDLIRASEIRSISVDIESYRRAINQFKEQYGSLPGDIPDAVKYWGAQGGSATAWGYHSGCGNNLTSTPTGTLTCNGNGDGLVGGWIYTPNPPNPPITSTVYVYESNRFWQHLFNAGFFPLKLTGVKTAGEERSQIVGVNIPATKISGVGVDFVHMGGDTGSSALNGRFSLTYGNVFVVGKRTTWVRATSPFLSPIEAYDLDKKFDDGMPAKGNLIANNRQTCTNSTSSDDLNAIYLKISASDACGLYFLDLNL